MDLSNQMVKINFLLKEGDSSYPEVAVESLWASPCDGGAFKIDNIPFFVRGVSCGDIINAELDKTGNLYYKKHVFYSKHSTFRVVFFDEKSIPFTRQKLKVMGCSSELSHNSKLIAIDTPSNVVVQKIVSFLAEGEQNGEWEYEEASVW